MKYIEFQHDLLFFSVTVLKHAIIDYAVEHKRDIWFSKNDLQRVQAKCKETCSWYLYASKIDVDGTFQVKSYNKDHSCILVNKHSFVRSDWIARKFGSQMRSNPKWKLREIQQHINEQAVKASTVEEFNLIMEEIKGISPIAYMDLVRTESRY
ncbi:hypothetical protein POM88_017683 [Heracleum sosnowskyi]|uniref:Transposase MuDR plant domain-containing protein n=1 Tax=Heracleum sosnowskyi TaxID=360622 RepID=A0AAD8MU31_9APIA|nr:hypothetical protein POM88_017683 [Heracleum sosnowskyi]